MSEQSPREQAAKAVLSTLNGLIPGAADGPTTVQIVHEHTAYGSQARDTWSSDADGFAQRLALALDTAVLQPLLARVAELEAAERLHVYREQRAAVVAGIEKAERADSREAGAGLPGLREELARLDTEAEALATEAEASAPRTERSRWVDIADALNAVHDAGMPVGVDLDGTLTDHGMWSVVWDRTAGQWTVAGYEPAPVPPGTTCAHCGHTLNRHSHSGCLAGSAPARCGCRTYVAKTGGAS